MITAPRLTSCSPDSLVRDRAQAVAGVGAVTRRVLLADDDIALSRLLSRKVARGAYEVHTAISGDMAMELIRMLHLDVAVLDVNMPGMNGLDLVRRIRTYQDLHQPAIVVISAFPDPESVQAAQDAGADVTLPKPFHVGALQNAIEQALATQPAR